MSTTRLKILALGAAVTLFVPACGGGKETSQADAVAREMFKMRCSVCHGGDGQGRQVGEMRTHSLTSESAMALTEERMFQWVKRGSGDMPSFASSLTDEQIRGLIRHVRKNIQGL